MPYLNSPTTVCRLNDYINIFQGMGVPRKALYKCNKLLLLLLLLFIKPTFGVNLGRDRN